MAQRTDDQLETTKWAEAASDDRADGVAEDGRAELSDEASDTQGYRWREEKVERPPFVDPWDGKPQPWGPFPIPQVPNP